MYVREKHVKFVNEHLANDSFFHSIGNSRTMYKLCGITIALKELKKFENAT